MTERVHDDVAHAPTVPAVPVFTLARIRALTDAAMTAFGQWYDIEMQARRAVKERLAAEMANLDLFGLTANKANADAEEYRPPDADWRS